MAKRRFEEDSYVLCPYYHGENTKEIRCSGVVGQFTTETFFTGALKQEHKENFCASKCYLGCPIYRELEDKEEL